jgi:hypothetical protein
MSLDRFADSQKKLELATNVLVAYINSSKAPAEKSSAEKPAKAEKESNGSTLNDKQILEMLEKVFNKMNELVPYQDRKIGLGH